MVRAAKIQAAAASSTIKAVLESILTGRFSAEMTDGKTLISTSEAGGSVSFAVPGSMDAAGIMALAEEAIEWLEQQPDPANPNLSPRRIKTLRASFRNAVI